MSSEQLSAIRRGSLPLAELLRINEHVRECAECAQHVATASDSAKRAADIRRIIEREDEATFHIPPDVLAAHVDDRLEAKRAASAEAHLQFCPSCAEDLADLRSLRTRPNVTRMRERNWLAVAATVLIAAATLLLTSRREQRSVEPAPPPLARRSVARPVSPPAPAARSAYGRADWNGAVAAARKTGRISVAATVATLRHPPSNLRSLGQSASVTRTLVPEGELVETTRPTFRWKAPAGATSVVLISTATQPVLSSDPLSTMTWQPSQDLKTDVTYSWQVEITSGEDVILAPRPPEPPALFRILTPAAQQEIAAAKQQFPGDHLLLAVLYAHYGVVSRARAELDAYIAAENPPNAASLRASLDTPRF